jgi:MMP 1-O-methyltransferase
VDLIARFRRRDAAPAWQLPPSVAAREELLELAAQTKGFLAEQEGRALMRLAFQVSALGPCLEIGSYCGKSALFLGEGCRLAGRAPTFTVDHHEGSEEQQPGEEYFDPELYDAATQSLLTLSKLRRAIAVAGLADWIIPIIGRSEIVGRHWGEQSLGLVFIDGSHALEQVERDAAIWSRRVARGGYCCFHDIFADPSQGGHAPYQVFEGLRGLRDWQYCGQIHTLGVLKRR